MQASQIEIAQTGSTTEIGKGFTQAAENQSAFNRRFGLMDLWTIRRSGRKFKIHNRIPRM